MSHFFAYIARMKDIQRWGLMRNSLPENIQEHSLQVAMIAHMLTTLRNKKFGGAVDAERTVLMALYHDCSEVITGDLPTPIKCFNPDIKTAYKEIEHFAAERIFNMLPDDVREEYDDLFFEKDTDAEQWALVKAADKLSAYIKCLEEGQAGNKGFSHAERSILDSLKSMQMPEIDYFLERFIPSFSLTLDELN